MAGGRRYMHLYYSYNHASFIKAECHCTQCGSSDRFNLANSLPRLVNQNIRGL